MKRSFEKLLFLLFLLLTFIPLMGNAREIKICLNMIVKNESAIIERCLDSTKDIIDCISICDTGSTDNTVEIIQQYMKKHGIPGEVYQHVWKNFGYNRSLSAMAAKDTLKKYGFSLEDTYLLLLDADMVLGPHPDFNKNALFDDSYHVMQRTPNLAHANLRLLHASLYWECVGVTHEYWRSNVPAHIGTLETLWIDDRNDGGSKADKFERDIRLLTQGLQEEPNNERYHFYLAQSYRCLRKHDEAIEWYNKRIAKGGWKEEVWFSKFMIGECLAEKGEWDKALQAYLDAYDYDPERAEPIYNIAAHYSRLGQNSIAYFFAKQGSKIPYPKHHTLFISHPIYSYKFDEILSISAFYTPFKAEGYEALNHLLLTKGVDSASKYQAYKNALFYVSALENTDIKPIKIELPKIRQDGTETYNPMNPTIQKVDDGYKLICRTVNYTQSGGLNHRPIDPTDSVIRTKNFLIDYDKNFNVRSQSEIVENLPRYRNNVIIQGLEDCRLIHLNDEFWITCSTSDTAPQGIPQIALCKLSDKPVDNKISVTHLVPLKGPDPSRCEKNWLPFVKDNDLHIIYSCDPFIVYKPNLLTGECPVANRQEPEYDFSHFRGSAPPIEFDNGYLMLVHEVAFTTHRNYLHRFVYLDKDLQITRLSKPFIFKHMGVEYTCGMTIDHSGQKLIIPFGIEDRSAYLCKVDLNQVRSLLEPLPPL